LKETDGMTVKAPALMSDSMDVDLYEDTPLDPRRTK
jgi:hypothetical protein